MRVDRPVFFPTFASHVLFKDAFAQRRALPGGHDLTDVRDVIIKTAPRPPVKSLWPAAAAAVLDSAPGFSSDETRSG